MKNTGIFYSNSRIKLDEADHFLNELIVANSNFIRDDTDRNFLIVRHKFSAFITAMRSITLYLQTDYRHTPGFGEWYASKQKDMATDLELRYLNKARVENVHIATVPLGMENQLTYSMAVSIVSPEEAKRRMNALKETPDKPIEEKSCSSLPDIKTIKLFVPAQAVFEGKLVSMENDVDLVLFCVNNYNKLKKMVDEWEILTMK